MPTSGDSATITAVVSSLIRHRGACAVGDIVTASDGVGAVGLYKC